MNIILVLAVVFAAAAAWAQTPRLVTIGTPPPGSRLYAVGSGLAKAVSGGAPFQMTVQLYSGTSTYFPMINNGEPDFGVVNAVDLGMAYQGPERLKVGGRNPFPFKDWTRPRAVSLKVTLPLSPERHQVLP